jgi:ubiquinone/menaquinone biosynthesis C-methylase UbiE
MGRFVTFKPHGFAAAQSIPDLLARHYYEVRELRQALSLVHEHGMQRQRVLEVGCGFGRLSPTLAEHFDECHSVDINEEALASARRHYPHVHYARASTTELPFSDAYFDAVMTWTVLQHVPNDLVGTAAGEIERVTRDASVLILCEATRYPERDTASAHTHDRTVDAYRAFFPNRPLLISKYFDEIDRIENLASPGRLMVFGPRDKAVP